MPTDKYIFRNGFTMEREYGKTPNGNDMDGRWVLRSAQGTLIDFDQYRSDLIGRHHLEEERNAD